MSERPGEGTYEIRIAETRQLRRGAGFYASTEKIERAKELRAAGASLRTIAREVGLSRETVMQYVPRVALTRAMELTHERWKAEGRPMLPPWRREPAATATAPALDVSGRAADTTPLTYEQRRSRRKHAARSRSLSDKRTTKRELKTIREQTALSGPTARPRTRGECVDGPRPCPFVGCKYHLYLDVKPRTGALTLNFPDLEPEELSESCSLDAADAGASSLERVGELVNLTRERVRQVENEATGKLGRLPIFKVLR